jgi:Domain of unknown function (DUF4278)
MQLTYRGAHYSSSSESNQPGVGAIGTYRGTKLMLGAAALARPVSMALRYRGTSYQSPE